jgi:hypothetical protein
MVMTPESEIDLVLEEQILDVGPELARDGLIRGVAHIAATYPMPNG